jgi:hypothetical protein
LIFLKKGGWFHGAASHFPWLVWLFEGMRRTGALFGRVVDVKGPIFDELRGWPVMIGDVDVLLYVARPNFVCDRKVMDALATNNAFFQAHGVIEEVEVGDMLMHIVSAESGLFNVVLQN